MNNRIITCLLFILLIANGGKALSQTNSCSPNIGFEKGSFESWTCYAGLVKPDGSYDLRPTQPIDDVHSLLQNKVPQDKDPYGGFPVNCPNGSGFSIKLGNYFTQAEAERVEYVFKVPDDKEDYSIIYNYAVVLQNPNHQSFQQPKFTARVFDVASNKYLECGSFEFIASPSLPGFKVSPISEDVFYKPWSPITINLFGYAGKTIRLEFTTNDCTQGGHFGYAYIDVNEDCNSPISGNVYCAGALGITLAAPYGFKEYSWYDEDFTRVLGNENVLRISPPPPANTVYNLKITPFPGQGCADTITTVIDASTQVFDLKVKDMLTGCTDVGVSLTEPEVTAGSTPGIKYSYFLDANILNYVPTPTQVKDKGNYYIRGVNGIGCHDIKPVSVILDDPPQMVVNHPPIACVPATVDITDTSIVSTSSTLKFTYWNNSEATSALASANALSKTGIYFIRGETTFGCRKTVPVTVRVEPPPELSVNNTTGCGFVDLTNTTVRTSNSPGITYTYWNDANTTNTVTSPENVLNDGIYYIKATSDFGCSTIKPVNASVASLPVFTVSDPPAVIYPATVNIMTVVSPVAGLVFSYWKDERATERIPAPLAVNSSGTYFIKGTNSDGCAVIKPVTVVINPPDGVVVNAPNAFSPNNDGINDVFRIEFIGDITLNSIKVFNRWGQQVYETSRQNLQWDGKANGTPLPVGTYYWVLEGIDQYYKTKIKRSGAVTILR